MSSKQRVFLSYASEDSVAVRRLYRDLLSRGLDVWFDKEKLKPGLWKAQIQKIIVSSRYFIVCLSESALRKTGTEEPGFQDTELNWAYNIAQAQDPLKFTIIPVRLEACGRGDHRLSVFQQYDFFEDWSGNVEKLTRHLKGSGRGTSIVEETWPELDKRYRALEGKAIAYHYAGDSKNESLVLEQLERVNGASASLCRYKGVALFNRRKYQEAIDAFDQAVRIKPDHAASMIGKALALIGLGMPEEALATLAKTSPFSSREMKTTVRQIQQWAENLHKNTEAHSNSSELHRFTAPLVGEAFRSKPTGGASIYQYGGPYEFYVDPDYPLLVETGQRVKKGTILCYITAMALINEIESDVDGVVIEILFEQGQPVEYGEPLFRIRLD